MPRLFFIHGYVERPAIFDQLAPLLPGYEQIRVNVEAAFGCWKQQDGVTARGLAQYLVTAYDITPDDVVIGHSMGGWIAINIKELTGCRVVQVASWTDQRKINFPTSNLKTLKWLAQTGLSQSAGLVWFFKKTYPATDSKPLYCELVTGMRQMTRLYLWQQLQTLFAPVPALTTQPDARIHARQDKIVFVPDEPYAEVPGDHFSLVFHAPLVAQAVRSVVDDVAVK